MMFGVHIQKQKRKLKSGVVEYAQLATTTWDPVKGRSVTKVALTLGRCDKLDMNAVARLGKSISSFAAKHGASPAVVNAAALPADPSDETTQAVVGGYPTVIRDAGGAYVLDQMWTMLGIDTVVRSIESDAQPQGPGRRRDINALERTLFALVAARALAPSSKLAAVDWIHDIADIPRVDDAWHEHLTADSCYRCMDWLFDHMDTFSNEVFTRTLDALDEDVNIVFFDTTSTYFETEGPDEPTWRDNSGHPVPHDEPTDVSALRQQGFRSFGKSKDSRDDLTQVIVGLAVTKSGIPLKCWVWPGNTTDSPLIRQVRQDMRKLALTRIIYAADRGFTSKANREELSRGGDGYIMGEKLRTTAADVQAALATRGAYTDAGGGLKVKEATVAPELITGPADRFIICYNLDEATRDEATRARHIDQLKKLINNTDQLSDLKRGHIAGEISTKPYLKKYLRVTKSGLLRINKQAITAEEKLDGKYLLRTCHPTMTPTDIAQGYKQLLEVERCWRDMKSTLDLRPVYHRREDRIRAHVQLCFLALLLVRITETRTNNTWKHLRHHLNQHKSIQIDTPEGNFTIPNQPTATTETIYKTLKLPLPAQITKITLAKPTTKPT